MSSNTALARGWTDRTRVGRPLWQRSLSYGLLWAGAIAAGEALSLPFDGIPLSRQLQLVFAIFQTWAPAGIGVAWFAFAAEQRRLPAWSITPLLVLAALSLSALQSLTWWLAQRTGISSALVLTAYAELPSWTNFFYTLWMTLFHGALFTAGCRMAMRAERTRHLLGGAQIARSRSEASLADAQLDALRSRIDPAFLLQAMAAIQRRYGQDAQDADRLLDELVAFLRQAMPGVRSGGSTLDAEIRLAQAYAELTAQIDPSRGRWRFDLACDAPALAFPPLLLLPLLDALAPPGESGESGEVTLRGSAAGMTLTVRGAEAATLPKALAYRIHVALQTLFSHDCSLQAWPGGLSVTLKPDRHCPTAATGGPRAATVSGPPTFHPLEKEFRHAPSLAP